MNKNSIIHIFTDCVTSAQSQQLIMSWTMRDVSFPYFENFMKKKRKQFYSIRKFQFLSVQLLI